jgi:hypothetical protein
MVFVGFVVLSRPFVPLIIKAALTARQRSRFR